MRLFEGHKEFDGVLTRDGLQNYLQDREIEASEAEIDAFFKTAKRGAKTQEGGISEVEFFANIHAYEMNADRQCTLVRKIALSSGMLETDYVDIAEFHGRADPVFEAVDRGGALMFVDAEQTFLQFALDSYTRQMQEKYNVRRSMIQNGYQSYLKSTERTLDLEL